MEGETSGPNEHEVRMATLEHKFDDLLTFVHMMVKRDSEMENRRKEDGKDTNDEVSERHPHINTGPPPRPPTPPRQLTLSKPKRGRFQLGSKIDNLEEKIQLM